MTRYIITSKKFTGQIIIAYNVKGTLVLIDMTAAELDNVLTPQFMRSVPLLESHIVLSFSSDTTVVQEDFKVTFDEFWNTYNHKINKKRCIPLWDKMTLNQRVKAFYGIREYDKFLKSKNRMKCDPENYLRNEMYENEYKY